MLNKSHDVLSRWTTSLTIFYTEWTFQLKYKNLLHWMYPLKKTKTHLKKHGIVKICSNSALYSTWNIYMYVSLQIGSWYLRGFSADSWWAIFKLIRTGKTKSLLLCYALRWYVFLRTKIVGLKFQWKGYLYEMNSSNHDCSLLTC